MRKKYISIAVSLLGLALLLTGCAGLFSQDDGGCPACGPALPAVPGDPTAPAQIDPELFGAGFIRGEYIPGELVVGYTEEAALAQVVSLVDGTVADTFSMGELKAALVELPAGMSVARALGVVLRRVMDRRDPLRGVAFVEPNYMYELIDPEPEGTVPTKGLGPMVYDPGADLRPYQWGLDAVGAEDAWAHATGAGVIVAVVDTGVDGTHPDLAGKVLAGYAPRTDTVLPAGTDSDQHGHGTHVAGIIAAEDDGEGIVGLAPDVQIMPIRIFEYYTHPTDGYGFWFVGSYYAAWGIIWAVDNGAQVLNHSWGGAVYSQLIKAAFDYTLANGAIPVCAAGNDGEAWIHFPSAYPGVIAVGATRPDDTVTDFSQLGGWLSVAAPGEGILSSVPTWHVQEGTGDPLLYDYWPGTSMASPFAAALAALLRELHPAVTPYQIKRIMENTAVDIEAPGFDTSSGYGRIDAAAAVTASVPSDGASAYIYAPTESSETLYGVWITVPYVDVVLLKDGEIRYWAQTDLEGVYWFGFPSGSYGPGVAAFYGIEPGSYQVLVGGDDQARFWSRTANRVTATGTLSVGPGDFQELLVPINTELQVRIDWTGAGDVDLAIWEGDWYATAWSTPKTGADWGTFSGDDDAADGDGTETYTLGFPHWDLDLYRIAIDAGNASVATTVTVTIIQNGVTEVYGPYNVPANSFVNLWDQTDWWDVLEGPWVF